MVFSVRFSDGDGWLEFTEPRNVVRATDANGLGGVFAAAEAAIADGFWIAGVIPYERSGAAIGIFDAPVRRRSFETRPFSLSPLLHTVSRDAYRSAIAKIQRAIYDGDVYQVNYTVPFDIALDGDPFSCWYAVAQRTYARYQAFVEDDERCVLSWSPELFLQLDGKHLTTRPMKGTSPPDDDAPLHDVKNRAEHIMIVDLLRNDLHRVCEDVTVSALCTIECYPTFATMTSTVDGRLRDGTTLNEIFEATFPCGSITGAPKRAAIEMIARVEGHPRGAYCGAIGFLSPEKRGWWNVAIRTAQFDGSIGRFDAGGGIVSDSDADDEWNEVRIKSAFLNSASSEFELWETFAGDASDAVIAAHLRRLNAAAERLEIRYDRDEVRSAVAAAMAPRVFIRLRLSLDGAMRIVVEELSDQPPVVDIIVSTQRVHSGDPWLTIKSSWRPAHRAAWNEAQRHGCFDALIRNERGEITEGSRTNIFAEIDGRLLTPPVASGALPGILREQLIAQRRAAERPLSLDDLRLASALYVGNSARGLLRARLTDSTTALTS